MVPECGRHSPEGTAPDCILYGGTRLRIVADSCAALNYIKGISRVEAKSVDEIRCGTPVWNRRRIKTASRSVWKQHKEK